MFLPCLCAGLLSESGQGGSVGWHGLEVAKYWTKLGKTAMEERVFQGGVVAVDGLYQYVQRK